jgi:DNA-binding NarL/FixJ family response regulator
MMRILIAVNDFESCTALQLNMVQQGFTVDVVGTADEFTNALSQHAYHAVLLGIALANQGGIALLSAMRLRGDATPVVLMSAAQSAAELVQGLDEGADDYIAKPFHLDEVCARLRAVVRRAEGRQQPLKVADANMSGGQQKIAPPLQHEVEPTSRQKEVLHLVAQGCQNKHIARQLNIAERTVKMHITALLELVGAKNRTHLLVIAGARGLL